MGSARILAADLFQPHSFADFHTRVLRFTNDGRAAVKRFIDSLLLYDEITIPTDDFLVLLILANAFSPTCIQQLLEANAIRFIHLRGAISYHPPGSVTSKTGGIACHQIIDKSGKPKTGLNLEPALENAVHSVKENTGHAMPVELILSKTRSIELADIVTLLGDDTIAEIRTNRSLAEWIGCEVDYDVPQLPPAKGDVVSFSAGTEEWHQPAQRLLSVFHSKLELWLAAKESIPDVSTLAACGAALSVMRANSNPPSTVDESLGRILRLMDIPNVSELVLNQTASFRDIVRLRETRSAIAFRSWFHEACKNGDAEGIARELIRLVNEVPGAQRMPARIIRFVVTSLLGLIPVVGCLASAADAFVVDPLLRGNNPKLFIEQLRQFTDRPR